MTILKILILLLVLYAIIRMWHWKIGFTFFTQLSNLYAAAVVLLQLLFPDSVTTILKYTAAVSLSVTFLVFLLILAPQHPDGFFAAYRQDHYASLCFHFLVPALTVTDFLLFDAQKIGWKAGYVFLSLLPSAAYFVFILLLAAFGMRWHGRTAPYPFLDRNGPAGLFGLDLKKKPPRIGVFYSVLMLFLLVLLIGWILLPR